MDILRKAPTQPLGVVGLGFRVARLLRRVYLCWICQAFYNRTFAGALFAEFCCIGFIGSSVGHIGLNLAVLTIGIGIGLCGMQVLMAQAKP